MFVPSFLRTDVLGRTDRRTAPGWDRGSWCKQKRPIWRGVSCGTVDLFRYGGMVGEGVPFRRRGACLFHSCARSYLDPPTFLPAQWSRHLPHAALILAASPLIRVTVKQPTLRS